MCSRNGSLISNVPAGSRTSPPLSGTASKAACSDGNFAASIVAEYPDPDVTHLGLVDFRSYAAVELDLPIGVTTFVGANGEGKTNLVEAIGSCPHVRSDSVIDGTRLTTRGGGIDVWPVTSGGGGRPSSGRTPRW